MGILEERPAKRDRDLTDRNPGRTFYGYPGLTLLEKDDKRFMGERKYGICPHYSVEGEINMFEDLTKKAREENEKKEKERQAEWKSVEKRAEINAKRDFPEIAKKIKEAAARGEHRCCFLDFFISKYGDRYYSDCYLECIRKLINNSDFVVRFAGEGCNEPDSGYYIIWG